MHINEKLKNSSDYDLLVINEAISSRGYYGANESAPYEGLENYEHWIEAVDSELHKRRVDHKH